MSQPGWKWVLALSLFFQVAGSEPRSGEALGACRTICFKLKHLLLTLSTEQLWVKERGDIS